MQSMWLLALLALGAAPETNLDNGTLLFLENSSSVVEFSTGGKIGHVALAFTDGEDAWIYEATPAKVRRIAAADYYAELARINKRRDADKQVRVWALRPERPYSPTETAQMREFLDAQIGRRYSVENYVKGKPGDGIHCAELASSTLARSGRYRFEECHRLNPAALYAALLPTHLAPQQLTIASLAVKETWCARAQRRWTESWTWCGWSCGEAWAFCW